ncbi:flagellar assembly factor FliW [Clostridium sp. USBA 49]|jgi:flagellar assembly factor FliW|uniref:flagellar assembly protein FliW n=1 Tax=Clostridium TaxID=1485 RepID=UPI00099AE75C|nr:MULTISPECIES: flagellar assembly protein FliW [Clostridium]SKA72715.1 flagellar assembly factor FliW [Clostridium sp. USBA 49]
MKFNTKYHGVKEFKEEDIIYFKKGLPGFEKLNKFILFSVEENNIFSILHSVENEEIGLVVASPFTIFKDYEFKLSDEKLKELKISSPEDVLVLNTVTLSNNINSITINLKAPIIINIKERLGEQIILDNEKYKIKHPLLKE